jgi:hypothetical protein
VTGSEKGILSTKVFAQVDVQRCFHEGYLVAKAKGFSPSKDKPERIPMKNVQQNSH